MAVDVAGNCTRLGGVAGGPQPCGVLMADGRSKALADVRDTPLDVFRARYWIRQGSRTGTGGTTWGASLGGAMAEVVFAVAVGTVATIVGATLCGAACVLMLLLATHYHTEDEHELRIRRKVQAALLRNRGQSTNHYRRTSR